VRDHADDDGNAAFAIFRHVFVVDVFDLRHLARSNRDALGAAHAESGEDQRQRHHPE
jgi:hypothetical protein